MRSGEPRLVAFLTLGAILMGAGPSIAADRPAGAGKAESPATPARAAARIERGADGEPAHFSVDMVMQKDGQRVVMRRHVDGPRSRMETEVEGKKVSIIDLGDEGGTTIMLMHSEKRAVKSSRAVTEQTADKLEKQKGKPATQEPEPVMGAIERLGEETLSGKLAEKFKVTTPEGVGTMWIEKETQLPLRMEAEGMVMELSNYDFSPQPKELFTVPKKYDVLDMDEVMKSMGPGAGSMMKGMMGAGGGMEGMGGSLGGHMGGSLGGQLGAGLGASVGGPVGAMVGQYLGQRIGQGIGKRAGTAVTPK